MGWVGELKYIGGVSLSNRGIIRMGIWEKGGKEEGKAFGKVDRRGKEI